MLLVAIFADETSEEFREELFTDLEETDIRLVRVFDDGCKIVIGVPDNLPKLDYKTTLEEYWQDVLHDSILPCCLSPEEKEKSEFDLDVMSDVTIRKLSDFLANDQKNNADVPGGLYGEELSDLL